MTVNEASKKLGVSKWAIYKMIERQVGIGKHFKKNKWGRLEVDGRKVK